ncbi:unnamed protein product [Cercopithifilaria johnstoni]|uniref:Uncharacterized protein n=1 Tax=Cercopithifilaria johnstoni TaxID=2874296 RepID=A0A8J2M499_9BILA|nr:unnamed protein product [Cercopithifilaria johnstoni]
MLLRESKSTSEELKVHSGMLETEGFERFAFSHVANTSPSVLELSELLEKQNQVLSALLAELETCKSEVLILRNKSSQQISDKKRTHAENSFKEVSKIGEILPDGSEKSPILEGFLEKMEVILLKAENLSHELDVKKTELSNAVEMHSLTQAQIDHLNKSMEKERETMINEFSKLNDFLVDKTRECDNLNVENSMVKAQLRMLKDSVAAKEKLVSDLTKATAKELAKREEEDKVLATRLSVLADENMTLRTSLLTLGANELSPQSKKLLKQQQDFIETLKSECEILMNRLMRERDEHRKERRKLRRQIRTLNARLECLISGKQEITDV